MNRLLALSVFMLLSLGTFAQLQVKGKIVDANTGDALAFVTIIPQGERSGTYSNIDGRFSILLSEKKLLQLSYVGYRSLTVEASSEFMQIEMQPETFKLKEAVVTDDENPAHRIVRELIARKDQHDPEKGMSFQYDSYNKLVFTADLDSAIVKDTAVTTEPDSSEIRTREFFEKQHIFLMESVTERKFQPPNKNSELVTATRVSGLKHPDFAVLGTQLQSFSFYKEEIELMGDRYLSPVANGALRKYVFTLEDTTYQDRDTVFIISYQPSKGKNFKGLKGLLYVNTNGYAIQSVVAEPNEKVEGGIDIRIRQKYEWIEQKKWFPTELNSTIYFNMVYLGNYRMVGKGYSYLKNIQLEPELERKDFNHVTLKLDRMATKQPDEYWAQHRVDSLDQREVMTYHTVDSIGQAQKLDLKLKTFQTLMTGKIPVGPVNIDASKIVWLNRYEGFRLGMGLETNDKVSRLFTLSGYGAYGTKDKDFKYGGGLRFHIDRKRDVYSELLAEHDVLEFGGQSFTEATGLIQPEKYYQLYRNRLERYDAVEFATGFRAKGISTWRLFVRDERRKAFGDYNLRTAANDVVTIEDRLFDIFTVGASMRLTIGEKFVETLNRRISMGTKYPILELQYRKGFDDVLNGNFDFERWDAMLSYNVNIKNLGKTDLRFRAAYINTVLPASMLINPRGTFTGQLGFFTPFAFETMYANEFLTDQFVSFHFRHNFRSLLLKTKRFAPEFVLVHNAAIGKLRSPERHAGINFSVPDKPFLEGGLQIDNLLLSGFSGIGVGAFYRYGDWAFPDFKDNLAIKLTLRTSF